MVCTIYKSKRRNGQIFGGTNKYFGGTSVLERQTRLKRGDEKAPLQASFVNQNEIKPKIG
jgi:hypothetical protein